MGVVGVECGVEFMLQHANHGDQFFKTTWLELNGKGCHKSNSYSKPLSEASFKYLNNFL